jgi:hypothetical protein
MLGQRTAPAQCIPNDLVFGAGGPSATHSLQGAGNRHTSHRLPSGKTPCNGPHCREKPANDDSPPLPAPIPSAGFKDLASEREAAPEIPPPPSESPPMASDGGFPSTRSRDVFHPPR